jgi:putative hydrolase of the HAD superfamily
MVRAVLADLDDTLFDHRGATRDALLALAAAEPAFTQWTPAEFDARHRVVLETLHLDVLAGRRSIDAARRERFTQLLAQAGVGPDDARIAALSDRYRHAYQAAWRPIRGARALAQAVTHAGVRLVIVTNNLVAEQARKLEHCGLTSLVDALVTSEEVGAAKPAAEIFAEALRRAEVGATEAVMFGDAWATDIAGATAAGIRAVWFNPEGAASPDPRVDQVESLEPLDAVLRILGVRTGESA